MIFATVGSHPSFKFERFLDALETVPAQDLVVQHGPGSPPANATVAVPWMSFGEILEHLRAASHVISHAGVGSVLCAVDAGHVPLVVPRLQRFNETVDDHQLDLAQALARTDRVRVVEEPAGLARALAQAPARGAAPPPADLALIAAVRDELHRF